MRGLHPRWGHTTSSYRGNPVPTVGSGAGYARHVHLPTTKRHPVFIPSCGLNKAIVIPLKIAPPDQRPTTVARAPIRHHRPDRRPATVSFRPKRRNLRRSSPPTPEAPAQTLRPPTGGPHFHGRWRRPQPACWIAMKFDQASPHIVLPVTGVTTSPRARCGAGTHGGPIQSRRAGSLRLTGVTRYPWWGAEAGTPDIYNSQPTGATPFSSPRAALTKPWFFL